jgi:hypothetical protein
MSKMVITQEEYNELKARASQAEMFESQISRLHGIIAELTAERVLDITKPKPKAGRPRKDAS